MSSARTRRRDVFDGEICGFGTAAGHRFVIGRWPVSPFGPVTDVMVEEPGGRRILLAPRHDLAAYIASTYTFDDVRVVPVDSERVPDRLVVHAGGLLAVAGVGRRGALGRLLRLVPDRVAAAPAWAGVVDPVARVVLRGVRTRGSAGGGRREWYGVRDHHPLASATARWQGTDLGPMNDVRPPVRFGFGSTPPRPSIVRVTTTIEVRAADATASPAAT